MKQNEYKLVFISLIVQHRVEGLAKRKHSNEEPEADGRLSEINSLISQFLREIAKDFNAVADPDATNNPIIYGFNIRMDEEQRPVVQSFGNIRPVGPTVKFSEEREPLIDIIDKERELIMIAELPGMDKRDIKITACNDSIDLNAKNQRWSYNRKIVLESRIDPVARSANYTNGVLEITFDKLNKPILSNRCAPVRIGERQIRNRKQR